MTLIKTIMAGVHHKSLPFISCHLIDLSLLYSLPSLLLLPDIVLFSYGPLNHSIVHSNSLLIKFSLPASNICLSVYSSLLLLTIFLLFCLYTHTALKYSVFNQMIMHTNAGFFTFIHFFSLRCFIVSSLLQFLLFTSVSQDLIVVIVVQLCLTLCDPMDCSMPGSPVLHISQFAQIHVHSVSNDIQPSHPLSSPLPALKLSQHQALLQ